MASAAFWVRMRDWIADDKPQPPVSESVVAILTRCKTSLVADWLTRAKKTPELNSLHLSDEQRTGHLPRLFDDIVKRLSLLDFLTKEDAAASPAAVEHGRLRRAQGYSAAMLIHESRILQVTIFGTLHQNMTPPGFKYQLLPDVMTIADEVDAQLSQTMESFMKTPPKSKKVRLVKPTVTTH
jgi:hypothetical protein